ncbi:hypothetical protein [Vitiosangium sp. GDMCC 1.1324]|uniref:cupredoxin domain-containing protein n=1 Tax=Vitiosangium sp. (strain GDMCC 1.1324) TaxID=2138576 RepID=UPI000D37865E|nr:hypothetical protein [Vitiosangium sp. GDMCC 1.1324]PTL85583.1 hypothetical protein DAT35_02385 [Vitiosangium sp. GDMCC 1.1324]
MRARLLLCFTLCLAACKGPLPDDFRPVQDSATGEPRVLVSLNRIISGRYRAIAPTCIGQQYVVSPAGTPVEPVPGSSAMRPGQIVEFRNYQSDVASNVTSLSAPASLFSPNLVKPYNIRTEGKETFSYWRYAFPQPGVYEYFDTNMGQPGRQVVDSYYGTVTYVGESSAPKAVVCVDPPGCVASAECLNGTAPAGTTCCTCMGVCCETDNHCTSDKTCLRGRCVDRETGQ